MAVYAEYIAPKRKADLLSDAVPWRNMILPGLILHKKQHGLQRSYRVRGPDLQGVSREEQGALRFCRKFAFLRPNAKIVC